MGRQLVPIALGVAALVVGTAAGVAPEVLAAIVGPPEIVRAALAGVAMVVGLALLRAALLRLDAARGDVPATARGIRLVFLAVAAFAAAAGWVLGHALPIVAGLVIAGIDVIETSFLLVLARTRDDPPG